MSSSTTTERVRELVGEKGLTPRDAAAVLGISTQRVYVIMRKLGITPPTKRGSAEAVA